MHDEQDIDEDGRAAHAACRATHLAFLAGALALAGVPASRGFFSKDEILLSAFAAHVPGQPLAPRDRRS